MKSNVKAEQQSVAAPTNESTIGLDLGDRWSRYCVVDQAGAVAKEDRVRTTPTALEEGFGVIPACRIVIEAGTHSPWISRLLERLGHQVIVANARKVRLIYESNRKNDLFSAKNPERLTTALIPVHSLSLLLAGAERSARPRRFCGAVTL